MADQPIIFSDPMVRALLAGRKSQTRRLLSLRGYRDFSAFGPSDNPGYDWHFRRADGCWCDVTDQRLRKLLPYAVGDRLYVREALYLDPLCIPANIYKADEQRVVWRTREQAVWLNEYAHGTVPSIHMPRWASRLTLTVTDVRVQRLGHMSEADAVAEGIYREREQCWSADGEGCFASPKIAFHHLWDSLHGAGAWAENPWVIALTFTVEQRNIDA